MNLITHRQHLLELNQLNQKKWNLLKSYWKDDKALEFDRVYLKNFRRQMMLSIEALDEMELIFNHFKQEYEQ